LCFVQGDKVIGSRLIGQPFNGPGYFHSRPSAAGNGYDGTSSGGTNLGPTSKKLIDQMVKPAAEQSHAENPNTLVPVDLITTSSSGLDPHITPAAAEFQVPRVAKERGLELTVDEEAVCPRVSLPATWEDYLLTLSKKDRHELRRKIRRLSEAGGTIETGRRGHLRILRDR
jgi:K+-transporting ATPase c subunit